MRGGDRFWRAVGVVVLGAGVWTSAADAVPRYSVRYGQHCVLCHHNPTGGGQRSLFGAQFFSYNDLAIKRLDFDELGSVNPMISDQVQIGFDARGMYWVTEEPAQNSFFQMQGDLYLSFAFDKRWRFLFDKGLRDDFEAFAVGHVLPWTGYVKFGQFVPPYGMRIPDHNAFVRERLGFDFAWKEPGIEVGFHPEHWFAAVALTNGTSTFLDTNELKAVTGRADVRFRGGPTNWWLGVTGRWNGQSGGDPDELGGGGYGGVAWGPLSLLGELDYREADRNMIVSTAEVAWLVTRGFWIRVEHDYHDPDVDVKDGADNMAIFGVEVIPTGFLQLIANLRLRDHSEDASPVTEGEIQAHVFY